MRWDDVKDDEQLKKTLVNMRRPSMRKRHKMITKKLAENRGRKKLIPPLTIYGGGGMRKRR